MDRIDKELLNLLQKEFPLSSHPFRELGLLLGLTEGETLERAARLKEEGYIRRIGGVFNTRGLGFFSTLVASRVKPDKVEEIAAIINGYRGVTHNYERNHYFNLWFTLTAASEQEADAVLEQLQSLEGIERLIKLPSLKVFKIELNLLLK